MTARAWREVDLGDVVEFLDYKRRPLNSIERAARKGPYPYYGASGPFDSVDDYLFDGRFLLVAEDGENLNSRKLPVAFFASGKFWVNNHAHIVRGLTGLVDDEFLKHWFAGNNISGYITGAAQPKLSQASMKRIRLLLPSYEAQRRIASILSAYDDLIENNTRRMAILEELARRIYDEWFVRFHFPGHEDVRMVESELGLVPEGWQVQAASTAMDINPSTKVPKEGLKPFLAMNCLSDASMLIDAPGERDGNSGSKFRNGDTLFARITPCLENGKTGFVQFLPSDEAVAFGSTEFIVLRSRTLTPEFVYLLARSDAFRDNAIKSMSGASGRQRVREACFDTFRLANPDQETLAKFVAVTRPMFQLIQSLARKNSNLRTTRDLLLPKLISGELDVSAMPEPEALAA
jgi:type I restriction enzyme S subunit